MKRLGLAILLSLVATLDLASADGFGSALPDELVGTGVVMGLNYTGDTPNSWPGGISAGPPSIIKKYGKSVKEAAYTTRTIAVVAIFAIPGPNSPRDGVARLKVIATGDATSLEGGTLLLTYIKGRDGLPRLSALGPLFQCADTSGKVSACLGRGVKALP